MKHIEDFSIVCSIEIQILNGASQEKFNQGDAACQQKLKTNTITTING